MGLWSVGERVNAYVDRKSDIRWVEKGWYLLAQPANMIAQTAHVVSVLVSDVLTLCRLLAFGW